MYVHTFMLYSTKLSRTVVLKQITISFQEPTNDPIYAEKTHFISLMRATHFSVSLSVLPTRSSKWLNINGQHGCSNTELYLCSSISTAQSRNLCTACSDSVSAAKCYKRTFQTTSTLISTNAACRLISFIFSLLRNPSHFSLYLVGQSVCLTLFNFSWHTLNASSGTLHEGQNVLMNWANWNGST